MKTTFRIAGLLSILSLSASSFARAEPPSVEWLSFNGTSKPDHVVITQEEVDDNDVGVLGYVRDLIGRSGLCYRGDTKEVRTKIVSRGIAWEEAESCDELKIDAKNRIHVGECTIDGVTSYSLSIGKCL